MVAVGDHAAHRWYDCLIQLKYVHMILIRGWRIFGMIFNIVVFNTGLWWVCGHKRNEWPCFRWANVAGFLLCSLCSLRSLRSLCSFFSSVRSFVRPFVRSFVRSFHHRSQGVASEVIHLVVVVVAVSPLVTDRRVHRTNDGSCASSNRLMAKASFEKENENCDVTGP